MDGKRAAEILQSITAAEREAGELILSARDVLSEVKSGRRDLVTQYDRQVQELMIRRLTAAVPGARFFCEENDRQDELDAEALFIIDPIDGTMNFVRSLHHSCISAALTSRGVLMAGAVYNPYQDEMFTALRGGGAFLNGQPIRVEDAPLAETVVSCGTAPYRPEWSGKTFGLIRRAFERSLDIRREGSAALDLCSVAAGRTGGYLEPVVSLWDYAAGLLLVQEAGGVCTQLDGSPMTMSGEKCSVLAASPRVYGELLQLAGEED